MTEYVHLGTGEAQGATDATSIQRVSAYWASLRYGQPVPERSAIDARDIAQDLPHVFLAELVTPRVARLRICGHHVEELFGMDMRGMPVSVMFSGAARDRLAEAFEQVGRGTRVFLSLTAEDGFGLPRMRASLALLPLADANGRVTRVMGVLERAGDVGRCPRRFSIAEHADPECLANPDAIRKAPALRVINGGKR